MRTILIGLGFFSFFGGKQRGVDFFKRWNSSARTFCGHVISEIAKVDDSNF